MSHALRLADILAALRQLDGDDEPPREQIDGRWWRRSRRATETGRFSSC
jgi:hypothetical protein